MLSSHQPCQPPQFKSTGIMLTLWTRQSFYHSYELTKHTDYQYNSAGRTTKLDTANRSCQRLAVRRWQDKWRTGAGQLTHTHST